MIAQNPVDEPPVAEPDVEMDSLRTGNPSQETAVPAEEIVESLTEKKKAVKNKNGQRQDRRATQSQSSISGWI